MAGFSQMMDQLRRDERIRRLRQYPQHENCNTYRHCRRVAICSYFLAKKLHWKVDEKALARGAMLHDYYQYDIKKQRLSAYRHGTQHAGIALRNAEADYPLTDKEKNIIYSHMWPLNLTHLPKTKEAVLVSLADKICAIREFSMQTPLRFHGRLRRRGGVAAGEAAQDKDMQADVPAKNETG